MGCGSSTLNGAVASTKLDSGSQVKSAIKTAKIEMDHQDTPELPSSDPVFADDDEDEQEPARPALAFMGKADVNERKLKNMKHFGLKSFNGQDIDSREAAATAATRDFFKKSTGYVPRVFLDTIFATYDNNGDGTLSVAELGPLAADLRVDHATLHAAMVRDGDVEKAITKEDLMHWFYNEHTVSQLRAMFEEFDSDKSGYLEVQELPGLLRMCAENINDENIEDAMATIDKNGDKKVSFEEFRRWFEKDCKLVTVRSFFSLYAGRGDNEDRIGMESLHDMLVAMGANPDATQVEKVMTEIDTNQNGFIELSEFIAWCAKTM